jgi:hypothetical protein
MAYSRDPNDLFISACDAPHPPPMNGRRQPVRYAAVRLRVGVGNGLEEGDLLPFVDVNWPTGELSVYADLEDSLCGVSSAQTAHRPTTTPWPSSTYAYEAEQFVRRGHSLAHAECRCDHGMPPVRSDQLGISPSSARTGGCTLAVASSASVEELCGELCVESALTYVDASGAPLAPLLARFLLPDQRRLLQLSQKLHPNASL